MSIFHTPDDPESMRADIIQQTHKMRRRISVNSPISNRVEDMALFNAAMRQADSRQQAINRLVDQTIRILSADGVGVYTLKEDGLYLDASRGLPLEPPAWLPADSRNVLGRSLYANKIQQYTIGNQRSDDCNFCGVLFQQGFLDLLVIPLRTSQKNVGLIFLTFKQPYQLSEEDEELLNACAEAAGSTLHRFIIQEQLEQTLSSRTYEQILLYDLMEIAGKSSELDPLLLESLTRIIQAANCTSGAIHFADPQEKNLILTTLVHFPEEFKNYLIVSGLSDQLWEKCFREEEIVKMQNIPDRSFPEIPNLERNYYTYLGIPIRLKGLTIGVLSLFGQSDRLFNPDSIQMLTSATKVIALAVENVHLRKKAEDSIVIHERQRLGRNLHDSVSQSLYALVIAADVSEKLLRIKDYAGLRQQLRDLSKVALQGLKEMRLLLYEFRPASLEPGGLVKALKERINTVESRAGMDVAINTEGAIELPPQLEQEIYQIAIESLNNSLKHAEATQVRINLIKKTDKFIMVLHDNGVGFDPNLQRGSGGIGMDSMRERTDILGGVLDISSHPGEGTTVKLEIPLARATISKEDYATSNDSRSRGG